MKHAARIGSSQGSPYMIWKHIPEHSLDQPKGDGPMASAASPNFFKSSCLRVSMITYAFLFHGSSPTRSCSVVADVRPLLLDSLAARVVAAVAADDTRDEALSLHHVGVKPSAV